MKLFTIIYRTTVISNKSKSESQLNVLPKQLQVSAILELMYV